MASSSNNNTTIFLGVDASGVESGVNKAKPALSQLNAAQDAVAQKAALVSAALKEAADNGMPLTARQANKLASTYMNLAATAGKSRLEILNQSAAAAGVSNTFSGMSAQIAAASETTHGFSLATGAARRELAVLGHEALTGNWTRFMGSLGVLGERTGVINLLFSGAGVAAATAAAGVAGLVYEVVKGVTAFDDLTKASALTQGYLGLTTDQMQAMSVGIAGTSGNLVTVQQAMTALVSSGQIAADQLALATKVTAEFASDTGISADKAAEAMIKFAEDPQKALETLQAQYHTFSAAQVEVIEGYINTGDKADAYKAILSGMDAAHEAFKDGAVKNLGYVQTLWDSLKTEATWELNQLQQIGVAASQTQKLADATQAQAAAAQDLARAQATPAALRDVLGSNYLQQKQAALDSANAQVASIQKVMDAQTKAAAEAKQRAADGDAAVRSNHYQKSTKYASPKQLQGLDLDAENEAFTTATTGLNKASAAYEQDLTRHLSNIAQINAQYAKKTRGPSPNAGINDQLAALAKRNEGIAADQTTAAAQLKQYREAGKITAADYYQYMYSLDYNALSKEIDIDNQRAVLASGKTQKSAMEAALGDMQIATNKRAALEQTLTDNLDALGKTQAANVRKYADQQAAALGKTVAGYSKTNSDQFLTTDQKAQNDALLKIQQDYETQLANLKSQYEGPAADQAEYQKKLAVAATYHDAALAAYQKQTEAELATRNSFTQQIQIAAAGIASNSITAAQAVGQGFTSTFNDMNGAIESFVTTGKGSFSSFATSVLDDLAKIALKAAESQIFTAVVSSFSTGGSVGHYATGGGISGAGTGTSDSIPIMASNGEYIINAASTAKNLPLLESINSGRMSKFASGGAVGSISGGGGSASGGGSSIHLSLSGNGGGLTPQDLVALAPTFQAMIDKRMAQKMTGQGGYADMIKRNRI